MANEFQQYLEESKTRTVLAKGHTKTLKDGKTINIDPYLTLRKINNSNMAKAQPTKGTQKVAKHVGDIMSVLTNPHVNRKLKRMITDHIEVHESPKVRHAQIKFKGGKMVMFVNPKYTGVSKGANRRRVSENPGASTRNTGPSPVGGPGASSTPDSTGGGSYSL